MLEKSTNMLDDIAAYYSQKIFQYGTTAHGVDWNSKESQLLRFEQLCKLIVTDNFSLNDIGCGYGKLFYFLKSRCLNFSYTGIDVSRNMIDAAIKYCNDHKEAQFVVSSNPEKDADYSMASGIFNVRFNYHDTDWIKYIYSVLDILNSYSRIGFSFNCLTSYSDQNKKRQDLFYADPCVLFDYCKRRYSKNVALLHDYSLYEFTIIVRKQ